MSSPDFPMPQFFSAKSRIPGSCVEKADVSRLCLQNSNGTQTRCGTRLEKRNSARPVRSTSKRPSRAKKSENRRTEKILFSSDADARFLIKKVNTSRFLRILDLMNSAKIPKFKKNAAGDKVLNFE
jgi:hypothetical protein